MWPRNITPRDGDDKEGTKKSSAGITDAARVDRSGGEGLPGWNQNVIRISRDLQLSLLHQRRLLEPL